MPIRFAHPCVNRFFFPLFFANPVFFCYRHSASCSSLPQRTSPPLHLPLFTSPPTYLRTRTHAPPPLSPSLSALTLLHWHSHACAPFCLFPDAHARTPPLEAEHALANLHPRPPAHRQSRTCSCVHVCTCLSPHLQRHACPHTSTFPFLSQMLPVPR